MKRVLYTVAATSDYQDLDRRWNAILLAEDGHGRVVGFIDKLVKGMQLIAHTNAETGDLMGIPGIDCVSRDGGIIFWGQESALYRETWGKPIPKIPTGTQLQLHF